MNTDTMFFAVPAAFLALGALWLILKRRRFEKNYPYEKKMLLTAAEYRFYRILKERCDHYHLLICPKVRMEDFLYVTDRRNVNKYRGYIKSRHIDFILCDRDLHMLAGLELDDASHEARAAAKTDALKNNIFKKIGVLLYRIPAEPAQYRKRIEEMLRDLV